MTVGCVGGGEAGQDRVSSIMLGARAAGTTIPASGPEPDAEVADRLARLGAAVRR
jgi:hypothetical protein